MQLEEGIHPYLSYAEGVRVVTGGLSVTCRFHTLLCPSECSVARFRCNCSVYGRVRFYPRERFNIHNSHASVSTRPHATHPHSFQRWFSVNVWAGILHDQLVGPYLLPHRLDGESYNTFLRVVLPELLRPILTPNQIKNVVSARRCARKPSYILMCGTLYMQHSQGDGFVEGVKYLGRQDHRKSRVWNFSCGSI